MAAKEQLSIMSSLSSNIGNVQFFNDLEVIKNETVRFTLSNEKAKYLDTDEYEKAAKPTIMEVTSFWVKDYGDNFEDEQKELEHCSLQEKLDDELKELDKRLEQKEAEMKRVAGGDTSVLEQHYEKKAQDLKQEKRNLQKEIEQLGAILQTFPPPPMTALSI